MYLYLDESGDLGFDPEKRSSKYFVITILVCLSDRVRREIRKSVKRTIKNKINKKKKRLNAPELKGTNSNLSVKKYFLRNIKDENWQVYSLILNKRRMDQVELSNLNKKRFYNLLSRVLLEELKPLFKGVRERVELIIDKSKNKTEIKEFNRYLENHLEALLPLNVPLKIYHLHSFRTSELQAVDLFSWGIFRKFESYDVEWYNCFSNKIKCEMDFWEQERVRPL